MSSARIPIPCTIAPWLTVRNGEQALRFYQDAFGARVVYRLEESATGVVARLSVEGAEFWLSDGQLDGSRRESLGGGSVRMILTVADPDTVFAQALAARILSSRLIGVLWGWNRIGDADNSNTARHSAMSQRRVAANGLAARFLAM